MARTQGLDAFLQRRMAHEQPFETITETTGKTERRQLIGQRRLIAVLLQALQCSNHLLSPGQRSTTGVGAKLALTAEPHDDDRRQYRQ